MENAAIALDHVSFSYALAEGESHPALRDVSLEIKKGEFTAVIGHNGSGKSTLAKMLNALLVPDEGKVTVLSMDTSDEQQTWNIRQAAGLVFQNPDNPLVTTLVEEDVAFGPENLGIAPTEIRERVDRALESVGMEAFALSAPHMLSGGQKQRIAIAGILAMEPQILILDESTAMLDPQGRAEVMAAVMKLKKERNMTVVWITHFMDEAAHADRVVVMDDGRIKMNGTPHEIFARAEELEAIRLDVPMSVRIALEMKKKGVELSRIPEDMETLAEEVCRLSSHM